MAKTKVKASVIDVTGNLKDGFGEPSIMRSLILEKIESLLSVTRDSPRRTTDAAKVHESFAAAEELIEILEVADCGSTGGFGVKHTARGIVKQDNGAYKSLRDRYEWLKSMPVRPIW